MRLEYEVVRLCGGHVFDAESYELSSASLLLLKREAGYYLVPRTRAGQQHGGDAAAQSIGPFPTTEHATRVLRELCLPGSAIDRQRDGGPATATVAPAPETAS